MKKVFYLVLASFLALAACGNEASQEKDNKTETTKKEEKQDKQNKSDDKKEKKNDKSKEDKQQEDKVDNEQQNNEQQEQEANEQQQVEQQQAQEQQTNQQQANQAPQQQEPSYEEQIRANAKVAKQHGYTGIPNGDMMATEEMEEYAQEQHQKNQQSTDNKYITEDNQDWRANTGDGLSSGEKQLKYQIENGTYQGEDEQEIYEALQHYEQQYGQ